MYEIEKEVPVPERVRGGVKESKYPFAEMAVGDSFFVANPEADAKVANRIRNASFRITKTQGYKFTIMNVDESEQGRGWGVRTWRVA